MRLLRESRRSLHRSDLILADSGYQGLDKICFQAKTPVKSSKKKPLNHLISSIRIKVEHVFGKVKAYKIFSTTYRNHRRRFNLRMNLICGIINQELAI
ncbi:transposase [Lactobacillus helveticus]|nr:transposase [Lactobacillus helveticus]